MPMDIWSIWKLAAIRLQVCDEGFDEIADWFETLGKAERSHANRFQKVLDNLAD